MKRKSAKEILIESFQELTDNIPIEKITVQDIVTNCDYSVATFYRYFHDKYELISFSYISALQKVFAQVEHSGKTWKDLLYETILLCRERKKSLKNLIQNTQGQVSFINMAIDINTKKMTEYIVFRTQINALDNRQRICVRAYCSGMVLIMCDWILDRISLTPEELVDVFSLVLPNSLKRILQDD